MGLIHSEKVVLKAKSHLRLVAGLATFMLAIGPVLAQDPVKPPTAVPT